MFIFSCVITTNNRFQLFIFIILYILTTAKCTDKNINCYYNTQTSDNKTCIPDINLSVKNITTGKAEVTFNTLLDCDLYKYRIILRIDENVKNKEDCEIENDTVSRTWLKHEPDRNYEICKTDDVKLQSCSELQSIAVEIPQIYTGCYRITVEYSNEFPSKQKSLTRFLNTNYKKNKIDFQVRARGYNLQDGYGIDISNILTIDKLKFDFTLKKFNYIVSEWKIDCPVSGSCNIYDVKNITVFCNSSSEVIECLFKNIEDGNYTMTMELIDEEEVRCFGGSDSVWSTALTPCRQIYTHVEIKRGKMSAVNNPEPDRGSNNFLIIIIPALLLVIIICIISMVYIRKRRIYGRRSNIIQYNEINENFEILLLYARDCDLMKDTMNALKDVLEENLHCNVYDIHDSSTHRDLSINPSDWLLSLLTQPEHQIQILLVDTHCGDLLLRDSSLQYRSPRFTDMLFLQAVQYLKDTLRPLYVLDLRMDLCEHAAFKCFTPRTRYTLPDNLDGLLQVLGGKNDGPLVQRFVNKFEEMENFMRHNSTYLTTILNILIEEEY